MDAYTKDPGPRIAGLKAVDQVFDESFELMRAIRRLRDSLMGTSPRGEGPEQPIAPEGAIPILDHRASLLRNDIVGARDDLQAIAAICGVVDPTQPTPPGRNYAPQG